MSTQGPLEVGDRVGDATVVQVAAGRGHTAALLADGRVVCWGENDHGQCAVPPDLGPAVQIAAGKEHTATLLSDGRVACWGLNERGQCAVPPDLGPAVQVAAGRGHTAALLSNGRVVCWGNNGNEECDVPADLGPAVQVAAGGLHTAALLSDGRVVCWGLNSEGQCAVPPSLGPAVQVAAGEKHTAALLSDGRTRVWGTGCDGVPWKVEGDHALELLVISSPALLKDFGDTLLASVTSGVVKQVAAGEGHTAALLSDGRTRVWGRGCDGVPWKVDGDRALELLCSSGDALTKWFQIKLVDSLPSGVKQVALRWRYTAALLSDGRVACWGLNNHGQCSVPPDLGPAAQIAAGASHTAALLSDGRVVCWGSSDDGQCAVPPDLSPAVQVAAGGWHTAALLSDGRVVCWGDGRGVRRDRGSRYGQCAVPPDLGPAVQVAAGGLHTAALLSDGRVVCWGNNAYGQCAVPPDLGPAVQVAAGDLHTAALLSDGRVVCWGLNEMKQCWVPRNLGPAVQVAAGEKHTAALLSDGRARVWGQDCGGVPWKIDVEHSLDLLITSAPALSRDFVDALQASVPSGDVTQLVAASEHTAALLSNGRVVCWGGNDRKQCAVPRDLDQAVQIAAGAWHTAALLSDGRVVCWGGNEKGQCDIPPALQGRVARVHAEGHSTWAVDVDGRLHGWGVTGEADSLPFELSDEAWLEFATRMWGKTKQRIYPEHVRRSAAFKAIRAMHKVAGD